MKAPGDVQPRRAGVHLQPTLGRPPRPPRWRWAVPRDDLKRLLGQQAPSLHAASHHLHSDPSLLRRGLLPLYYSDRTEYKVRQVCDGGVRRFGISLETVRSATSIPSFKSSPWILGAPHRGFASAIRLRTALISGLTGGRPPVGWPESLVQCRRKRPRRHRRTVSGATITKALRHPAHTLDRQTQKSRSLRRSFGRLAVLLYTASCWRRARFSKASCRWPPQKNGQSRSRWSSVLIMEGDCLRIRAERSTAYAPDGVLMA